MNTIQKSSETTEKTAQILVQVLLRHFIEYKTENGEEKTGIPPQRMPNTHGHTNWRTP